MKFVFYTVSFLLFPPIGIYAFFKKENKDKLMQIFGIIFFSLKFLFDLSIYFFVLKESKDWGFLYVIFIFAGISLTFYGIAYDNKRKKVAPAKKKKSKEEAQNRIYFFNTSKKKSSNLNIASTTSNLDIKKIEAYKYLNTGEIYTFDYMGATDSKYYTRNITVDNIYIKNNNIYIHGFDVDIDEERTFREDRVLPKF